MTTVDHLQHSFDNFGLHSSAIEGDREGVRRALILGADVNALDAAGRTAIMCAVAGKEWKHVDASDASFITPCRLNVMRMLLVHPDISLFTLNAPQSAMNGVTPLGMAAWLNLPEAVRLLLEGSAGIVSVDGMDSHGATALMYAARDGNVEVVQLLLRHGARPDFRDRNHRTAIQFALAHPQIVWLCETVVRRHRCRERKSAETIRLFSSSSSLLELAASSLSPTDNFNIPPFAIFTDDGMLRLTDNLIQSILSSDLSLLHSLLFSPLPPSSRPAVYPMSSLVLVNRPDFNGWSPIHHCVSVKQPSIDILHALYCAGADVSLFTINEHYTPLHCLAQSAQLSVDHPSSASSLYQFTVHLIRDLHAPLSARDKDDETCIHIAAEHGNCIELLMAFLDCDITGCVRELRNARGLTALEVAKPEFYAAFGQDGETLRSVPSLSDSIIGTTAPFVSMTSLFDWSTTRQSIQDDAVSIFSSSDFDIAAASRQLLTNLRLTSPVIHRIPRSDLLHECSQISHVIFRHFRSHIEEATEELQDMQVTSGKIGALLDSVSHALNDKLEERGLQPVHPRKRNRDSEDSEATIVPSELEHDVSACLSVSQLSIDKFPLADCGQDPISTQTDPVNLIKPRDNIISDTHSILQPELLDNLVLGAGLLTDNTHLTNSLRLALKLSEHGKTISEVHGETASFGRGRQLRKKGRKDESRMRGLENKMRVETKNSMVRGSTKLKAWLKRKIMPDRSRKLDIIKHVGEDCHPSKRDVKSSGCIAVAPVRVESSVCDDCYCISDAPPLDKVLQTSHVVLAAASRDLLNIEQCLSAAEQFIDLTNRSISKAEYAVKIALKKRDVTSAALCPAPGEDSHVGLFIPASGSSVALGYSNYPCFRRRIASLSSAFSSTQLSRISLIEDEDEDTQAIRRSLRKIEAGVGGAFEEMDNIVGWLDIVKEAIRGVNRRAYV